MSIDVASKPANGKSRDKKRKAAPDSAGDASHAFDTDADFVALGSEAAASGKKGKKKQKVKEEGAKEGQPAVASEPTTDQLAAANGDATLAALIPPGLSPQAAGRLHKLARQKVKREKIKDDQRERKEVRLGKERERSSAKKAKRLEKAKAALAVAATTGEGSADLQTVPYSAPTRSDPGPLVAGGPAWFVDTAGAAPGAVGPVIDDATALAAMKAEKKRLKKERKAERATLAELPKAERKKRKKEARAAKRDARDGARSDRVHKSKELASAAAPDEGSASPATVQTDAGTAQVANGAGSTSKPTRDPEVRSAAKSTKASSAATVKFLQEHNISYIPAEAGNTNPPVLGFDGLEVAPAVKAGLSQFKAPTPIQSAVWPVLLGGHDVIGIAETGSGKTLGFGIPALQHIQALSAEQRRTPTCLVICPTRELAMQTHDNLAAAVAQLKPPVKSICLYGGVDKKAQARDLKRSGPDVVVGTPGRLLDLAQDETLRLGGVSYLVLDEADRMLDKGFENDIRRILGLCLPSPASSTAFTFGKANTSRLTAMFSATWPNSVRRLAEDFMCKPVRVNVGSDELAAKTSIEQTVIVLDDGRQKENRLLAALADAGHSRRPSKAVPSSSRDKCLVFALYKKEAQRLYRFLQGKGFEVGCIEGDMTQDRRTEALNDFRAGNTAVLVATDVAARGLDIPKVELVINCTFPLTIEDYIHRIGRTGRAGRTGKSLTFFTEQDKAHAGELVRVLRDAGQTVPEDLLQFGTAIKKKQHSAFGAHFKEIDPTVKPTKITF